MRSISTTPDLGTLDIPMDAWTQPFWDAASQGHLRLPRCAMCHRFRWPPGPFCFHCQSQQIEWREPGVGHIYSFTLIAEPSAAQDDPQQYRVPALIEFPDAQGIRILAAIIDSPLSDIGIGVAVALGWSDALNAKVPVFRTIR